jgi:hypothetical protein
VDGTARVTPSDTLELSLEATAYGGMASRALAIEAGTPGRTWLRGSLTLDAAGRGTARLRAPVPPVAPGPHVLRVAIADAGDREPRDDARLFLVTVVPTPGIVLVARPPTWESRFLLQTVAEVAELPVRGFVEVERGTWRRAGSLVPVASSDVADAVRRADLLIVMGSQTPAPATRARGRWDWPGAGGENGTDGDWYLSVPAGTPLGYAFAGLTVDSFPPGTAIAELSARPTDWVGLTAQSGRRGGVRPVLLGRDSARIRRIVTAVDGLWRWAFRGGSSEQGYRSLVAAAVSWLLGGADSARGMARPVRDVVQRGRPAAFQWVGEGAPRTLAVQWSREGANREDTLRFDGSGRAETMLAPGVWSYRLEGGGAGTLAVEEYSDEWIPIRPALEDRPAAAPASNLRLPLRGMVWLFGIAVAAFAGEWYARRVRGMR